MPYPEYQTALKLVLPDPLDSHFSISLSTKSQDVGKMQASSLAEPLKSLFSPETLWHSFCCQPSYWYSGLLSSHQITYEALLRAF